MVVFLVWNETSNSTSIAYVVNYVVLGNIWLFRIEFSYQSPYSRSFLKEKGPSHPRPFCYVFFNNWMKQNFKGNDKVVTRRKTLL